MGVIGFTKGGYIRFGFKRILLYRRQFSQKRKSKCVSENVGQASRLPQLMHFLHSGQAGRLPYFEFSDTL